MQISFLNCWTTFTEENVQMFSRNSSTIIWNWCHRMNQNSKLTLAFFYAAFACIRVIVDNDPVSMEQCPQAIEFISIRGCFCSCNGMLYHYCHYILHVVRVLCPAKVIWCALKSFSSLDIGNDLIPSECLA